MQSSLISGIHCEGRRLRDAAELRSVLASPGTALFDGRSLHILHIEPIRGDEPRLLPAARASPGSGAPTKADRALVVTLENRVMTRLPRAVFFAFLLGAVGFLAGYIAPLNLDPESTLGPLTGFFVTGPLGFLAGLALGVFAAWHHWSTPALTAGAFLTALVLCAGTVFMSFPDDRWVADVVDGTIVRCLPPERLKSHVLKYWSDSIALNPQNPVSSDWRARVGDVLKNATGRVAEVDLVRKRELYLGQKPWNRGKLLLRPVVADGKERFYTTAALCASELGHRHRYLAHWYSSSGFPPSEPAALLNLETLEHFPGTASGGV